MLKDIQTAWRDHKPAAIEAWNLFRAMAPESRRIPGMDTAVRLAFRISLGRTPERAAALEYLYRWRLWAQGYPETPHLLGL